MNILKIESLVIPEIKLIHYRRFCDERGYFTETFKQSQFLNELGISITEAGFQINEAFSFKNTLRGLHFQWNPFMGKLIRCIKGHLIDLILDIRIGSPTCGKIIAVDLPDNFSKDESQLLWVPVGFAHGTLLIEDSLIEYVCNGEYNPNYERSISPFSKDINWELCDSSLKSVFDSSIKSNLNIKDKDLQGLSLEQWFDSINSLNFRYITDEN